VLTALLDAISSYALVRVLTAPFIWLGTNSLTVFAGDILLQVCQTLGIIRVRTANLAKFRLTFRCKASGRLLSGLEQKQALRLKG
jgi:hypothetical protein